MNLSETARRFEERVVPGVIAGAAFLWLKPLFLLSLWLHEFRETPDRPYWIATAFFAIPPFLYVVSHRYFTTRRAPVALLCLAISYAVMGACAGCVFGAMPVITPVSFALVCRSWDRIASFAMQIAVMGVLATLFVKHFGAIILAIRNRPLVAPRPPAS